MLLVSRSGLVEDDAVEVFYYCGFHLSSSFLKLQVLSGKIMCSIPVSFPDFHAVCPTFFEVKISLSALSKNVVGIELD